MKLGSGTRGRDERVLFLLLLKPADRKSGGGLHKGRPNETARGRDDQNKPRDKAVPCQWPGRGLGGGVGCG